MILIFTGSVSPAFPQNQVVATDVDTFVREREFNTICPQDFLSTRAFLDDYLQGAYGRVLFPAIDLKIAADLTDLSQSDFNVLEDQGSSELCRKLNERYSNQWKKTASIHEHVEPMYIYDISYYAVADFIIVVRGGGGFVIPSPDDDDQELIWIDRRLGPGLIVYDKLADSIERSALDNLLERRRESVLD